MPASYAHYRFGKQVLADLPGDVRQCIQRFRRMYDLGLQGPDFFFYYHPYLKTAIGALGNTFHSQTGEEFFTQAAKAATSDAAKAYLYGLLGHYCLDSTCHPYVNQLEDIGEARHVPLESEFERFLLALDKEPSPHTYDISKRLKPTRGECMTIAELFPGATGGAVSLSFGTMAFIKKLLADPKQGGVYGLACKLYPSLPDHRIPEEENEELGAYVRELHSLYQQAAEKYPAMLAALLAHRKQDAPLGADFTPTFG